MKLGRKLADQYFDFHRNKFDDVIKTRKICPLEMSKNFTYGNEKKMSKMIKTKMKPNGQFGPFMTS